MRENRPAQIELTSASLLCCRMQKMPDDVDALRRAVEAVEEGYRNALLALDEGITELELACLFSEDPHRARCLAGDYRSWGSGERSAFPTPCRRADGSGRVIFSGST